MKKWIWYIIVITIFIISVISAILFVISFNRLNAEIEKIGQVANYNSLKNEKNNVGNMDIVTTSYSGTKLSPNARLIFKNYHSKCGHTVTTEEIANENIVNKNEYEISEIFLDWDIKKFSASEVVFYKESNSMCGEDFIIKNQNGNVCVIKIDKDGIESLYKDTEIEVQYLPEDDKESLR